MSTATSCARFCLNARCGFATGRHSCRLETGATTAVSSWLWPFLERRRRAWASLFHQPHADGRLHRIVAPAGTVHDLAAREVSFSAARTLPYTTEIMLRAAARTLHGYALRRQHKKSRAVIIQRGVAND